MKQADQDIIQTLREIKAIQQSGGGGVTEAEVNGLIAAAGGRLLDTAGAPSNAVGANGDYAFDDATKTIYGPKAAGVWPSGTVLGGGGSGGLIGTAYFDPTGGTIANPAYAGVVSVVIYNSAGSYEVVFSGNQPDLGYGISVTFETAVINAPLFWGLVSKSVSGFVIEISQAASNGGGNLGIPIGGESPVPLVITITRFTP